MNLVLLEPGEVTPDGDVVLSDGRAHHLLRVLQVTPGQPVRVGVVDGPLGSATVVRVGPGTVQLSCALDGPPTSTPRIDLLLALPRPKVMRRLWAQLAALGVRRILVTNAERVERNYFDTHVLRPDCYRPLLLEGLQQARDTRVPIVTVHRRLKVLIEDELDALCGPADRLMATPGEAGPIRSMLDGASARALVAIGPEGGWSSYEAALFEEHGFRRVSMGVRTLRTDTACIAVLTLVHDALAQSSVPP